VRPLKTLRPPRARDCEQSGGSNLANLLTCQKMNGPEQVRKLVMQRFVTRTGSLYIPPHTGMIVIQALFSTRTEP